MGDIVINIKKFIDYIRPYLKKVLSKMCYATIFAGVIGVIGHYYITKLQQRHEERKEIRIYKKIALKSLRGFIKDAETLRINASMLHSALRRYSSNMNNTILKNALLERKKSYDASYVHWFSTVQKNALFIRSAQKRTYPTLHEYAINEQLNFFFKVYDSYLTNSFDDLIINKKTNPKRDARIKSFLHNTKRGLNLNQGISEKITRCTTEIFNATHDWIAKDKDCNHPDWNKNKLQEMYNTINSNKKCGFNQSPEPLSKSLFPYTKSDGTIVNFCIE